MTSKKQEIGVLLGATPETFEQDLGDGGIGSDRPVTETEAENVIDDEHLNPQPDLDSDPQLDPETVEVPAVSDAMSSEPQHYGWGTEGLVPTRSGIEADAAITEAEHAATGQ